MATRATLGKDRRTQYFGDDLTVELPAGSGNRVTLKGVADDLSRRLISIFLEDADGVVSR